MLHILLTILKIIGILLVVILSLLLVLLCICLFVPVRYRVRGEKSPGILWGEANISWLFHIISTTIRYEDNKSSVKIMIFGICLGKRKKKKQARHKNKKNKSSGEAVQKKLELKESVPEVADKQVIQEEAVKNEQSMLSRKEQPLQGEKPKKQKTDHLVSHTDTECLEGMQTDDSEDFAEQHTNTTAHRISLLELFRKKIKNLTYHFHSICDKIKSGIRNVKSGKDFIMDQGTKNALRLCKVELIRILKHVRPRKIRAYIRIGMEDPALTGKILAGASILYPLYKDSCKIVPEFGQNVLEGNLYMKGRVRGIVMLFCGLKIFFNKDVKKIRKKFMK